MQFIFRMQIFIHVNGIAKGKWSDVFLDLVNNGAGIIDYRRIFLYFLERNVLDEHAQQRYQGTDGQYNIKYLPFANLWGGQHCPGNISNRCHGIIFNYRYEA